MNPILFKTFLSTNIDSHLSSKRVDEETRQKVIKLLETKNLELFNNAPTSDSELYTNSLQIKESLPSELISDETVNDLNKAIKRYAQSIFSIPQKDYLSRLGDSTIFEIALFSPSSFKYLLYYSKTSYRSLINLLNNDQLRLSRQTGFNDLKEIHHFLKNFGPFITRLDLSAFIVNNDYLIKLTHLCPNLQHISLDGSQISSIGCLANLKNLKSVNLSDCVKLDDVALIQGLSSLNQLEELSIEFNPLSDGTFLKHLNCPLRLLSLADCEKLKESNLEELKRFKLEILNLQDCLVTGEFLSILQASLQSLNLSNCSLLEEKFLKYLGQFPNLSFLFLSECTLTGKFLKYVSTNLRELNLSECTNLEEINLRFLKRFNQLQILHLDDNPSLNGNFLEFINPSTIEELGISSTSVTLENFMTYIPTFVFLKMLSIMRCEKIKGHYFNFSKNVQGYVFPP